MLRTLKAVFLVVALSAAAPAVFAQMDVKAPAYDPRGATVLDSHENCVLTKWEGTGECGQEAPAAPPAAATAAQQQASPSADSLWRTIFFDFDSAELTVESKQKLNKLYNRLTDASERVIRANIVGYTDEIGANDYNYALSQKRAGAVHAYLEGLGYQASNVTAVRALGERATDPGHCPSAMKRGARIACLWEDRRVEIELDYMPEQPAAPEAAAKPEAKHMHLKR